ncbi:hypothetical protein [Angustibacter aerolatus]|uniref:PIN domain-containing protein n=1 Tax=Angustibacter aerolatus TaxID=1162965 RepID=A0ABQ6JFL5_9ACTN|nr:hypothetical protein [Angustibacter aerolatus]GMA85939.1 hypothetical protein GCM10025868_11890 [Angustibacter aerolatus]
MSPGPAAGWSGDARSVAALARLVVLDRVPPTVLRQVATVVRTAGVHEVAALPDVLTRTPADRALRAALVAAAAAGTGIVHDERVADWLDRVAATSVAMVAARTRPVA